jgi:hypothetical protein
MLDDSELELQNYEYHRLSPSEVAVRLPSSTKKEVIWVHLSRADGMTTDDALETRVRVEAKGVRRLLTEGAQKGLESYLQEASWEHIGSPATLVHVSDVWVATGGDLMAISASLLVPEKEAAVIKSSSSILLRLDTNLLQRISKFLTAVEVTRLWTADRRVREITWGKLQIDLSRRRFSVSDLQTYFSEYASDVGADVEGRRPFEIIGMAWPLDAKGDKLAKSIKRGFEICTNALRLLDFRECVDVTDEALSIVLRSECCANVEVLLLAVTRLTNAGMITIANSGLSSLRELDVSCNAITDAGVIAVANSCKKITRLRLAKCRDITDTGVIGLRSLPLLQSLALSDCKLVTDECVIELLQSCDLRELWLDGCVKVGDRAIKALAAKPLMQLVELPEQDGSNPDPVAYETLIDLLCNGAQLLHLGIRSSPVVDNALLQMLTAHHLTHLVLYRCKNVSDEGIIALIGNISKVRGGSCALATLNIAFCGAPDERKMDKKLGWLETGPQITDAAINCIARNCPQLTTLCISGSIVSDEGLEAISRGCKHIELVSLYSCKRVTDKGIEILANQCKALHSLDLSHCPELTDQALLAIGRHGQKFKAITLANRDTFKITDSGKYAITSKGISLFTC